MSVSMVYMDVCVTGVRHGSDKSDDCDTKGKNERKSHLELGMRIEDGGCGWGLGVAGWEGIMWGMGLEEWF